MLKSVIAGAGAVAVTLGTATVIAAPAASAQEACTPVHIVSIPGAGSTHSGGGNEVNDNLEGAVARAVQAARPDAVSIWQPAYPASAGAAWSAVAPGNDATTFGDARLKGDKAVLDHLKEYSSRCSDSKIAVLGFSEGAAVGGDVLALLANGAVEGISDENILGGILFADPGRSGKSQFSGPESDAEVYIEHPEGVEYQRNGEYSTPTSEGSIGWVGQRSLDFGNVGARVISICNDADIACSVPEDSPLRRIADISDKALTPNAAYRSDVTLAKMIEGGKVTPVLAQAVLMDDILASVQSGNISQAIADMDGIIAQTAGLTENERGQLLNLTSEVRQLIEILRSDDAYGTEVTEGQILKHALSTAGTSIPQIAALAPILNLLIAPETGPVPEDVAARVEGQLKGVANFGAAHGVYWGENSFKVNGMIASDWATQALIAAVDRAVNGEPLTVGAGDSPRDEAETQDPDRADDGLQTLLDTGELPGGQDPDPVPTTTVPTDPTDEPTTSQTPTTTRSTTPISSTDTDTDGDGRGDGDGDGDGDGSGDGDGDGDGDGSATTTSTTSATAPSPAPLSNATPSPVANSKAYGPKVETGGTVSENWLDRLLGALR